MPVVISDVYAGNAVVNAYGGSAVVGEISQETATIPDVVRVYLTVPSATIANQSNQTVIPDPVAVAVDVPAQTVANQSNQTVQPDVVEVDLTTPAQTVANQSNQTVIPDPVVVALDVPELEISEQTSEVVPDPVAVLLTVPSQAIANQSNQTVQPDPAAVVVTVPAQTVANQSNQTSQPDAVAVELDVPSLTVANQANQTVQPDPVAVLVNVPSVTIANQSNQTVQPDPVAVELAVPSQTVATTGGEYHPPITTNIRFDFTYGVNTLYSTGTTVSEDTDPIATIVDESASSNDATQPTTARKPTNDDTNDEIDLDGSDDFMLIPGLVGLSENSTHYIVHRTNTMQDDDYIFGFTADGFVNTELRLALNDASPDNYRAVARSTTTLNDAFGGTYDTDLHLFTVLLDGANMVVRMDGTQIITVAYPGDFNDANIAYYVLGARYRGETAGLGNAIAGAYKGLYVYEGVHDSSDLATNEASIMTQHGIS